MGASASRNNKSSGSPFQKCFFPCIPSVREGSSTFPLKGASQEDELRDPKAKTAHAEVAGHYAEVAGKRARSHTNLQTMCSMLRMIATMLLIPIIPSLITALSEKPNSGGWSYATYSSTIQFYGALVQLSLLPYAGALSDRYLGRKYPLLLCGIVQLVYFIALKCADYGALSLPQLMAVALINQPASFVALAITSASLADVWAHEPSMISKATGKLMGISFGGSMLLGPGLGPVIAKTFGGRQAALNASLFMSICSLLTQGLLLRESAPIVVAAKQWKDNKSAPPPLSLRSAFQGVNPFAGLQLIFFGGGRQLRALGIVALFYNCTRGEQAIYMPFMLETWKLNQRGIAVAMTVVGLASSMAQVTLAGPLSSKFGSRGAVMVGLGSEALKRLVWLLFTTPEMMGLGLLLGAPGFTTSAFLGQMAAEAWEAPNKPGAAQASPPQGEISAALTAVSTLAVLLSSQPIGWLLTYGKKINIPGLPFAFGGMCCVVSILCFLTVARHTTKKQAKEA